MRAIICLFSHYFKNFKQRALPRLRIKFSENFKQRAPTLILFSASRFQVILKNLLVKMVLHEVGFHFELLVKNGVGPLQTAFESLPSIPRLYLLLKYCEPDFHFLEQHISQNGLAATEILRNAVPYRLALH